MNSRTLLTSSGDVTIGSRILTLPDPVAAARRIARSCVTKSFGCAKQKRRPLRPSEGFSSSSGPVVSFSRASCDMTLSPPRSAVRITTGWPFIERMTRQYALYCSSSQGRSSRFMKRNSVRKSPTPSAPARWTSLTSSGSAMLAKSLIVCPSSVTASNCLSFLRRFFSAVRSFMRWRAFLRFSAEGLRSMSSSSALSRTGTSVSRISQAPLTPTRVGISSERARMTA